MRRPSLQLGVSFFFPFLSFYIKTSFGLPPSPVPVRNADIFFFSLFFFGKKKIAESHETPTPRAISERIFKIKSMAKSSSSSSSSSSAPSSPQKIKSDSSTSRPIKSDKKDAAAPPKATGSPRSKRKRAGASTGTKAESK